MIFNYFFFLVPYNLLIFLKIKLNNISNGLYIPKFKPNFGSKHDEVHHSSIMLSGRKRHPLELDHSRFNVKIILNISYTILNRDLNNITQLVDACASLIFQLVFVLCVEKYKR